MILKRKNSVRSILFFIPVLLLIGYSFALLASDPGSGSSTAALAAAYSSNWEISPVSIEQHVDQKVGRYAGRTFALAFEIDRDQAKLIRFTLKGRPFIRSLELSEPVAYQEGKNAQIEVVLIGQEGSRYTQRVDIGKICLAHSAEMLPHVIGDTILVHHDTFTVEVPEIRGFDGVEIAYYVAGMNQASGSNGTERRSLAVEKLGADRFTPAGSTLSWKDSILAKEGDGAGAGTLATSGAVHWPEDYGDPDIYKVYGNETETDKRINVVLVPDGYTYAEKSVMESHATALVNYFRGKTPYKEHDPFLNYYLVYAYSTQSGTDQCDCNIIKDTAMASRFPNDGYPCGDSGNRCLYYGSGCDTNTSYHIADAELRAPAKDTTFVMVNTPRYGGCGGERAVYSAANSSATEIAVHELAHSLGGLADEYTSYPTCGWYAGEINTSKNSTNGAWPEWIAEIGSPRLGAEYFERCIYRPKDNCDMRSLNQPFCNVCIQRYSLVFFDHWRVKPTAPIESRTPVSPVAAETDKPVLFSVQTRLALGGGVTNSITWKIQGPGYPDPTIVATGVTTYERSFSQEGSYTLWCEVIADTNFIKPTKNGANVDTVSWNITVTMAKPGEVSPPGTVHPLVFADKRTLTWEEASMNGSTTFNLYRGYASLLSSGNYGTCFKSGIATNTETDPNEPPGGICWTYLVTGKNGGGEGTMGEDSTGSTRPNSNPCP